MAAAVAPIFNIFDRSTPEIRGAALGWIGSKACSRGHFVTVDSNGYIDQAAAAGAAVSSTLDVAVAVNDIASTVAAAADEALDFQMRVCSDQTEIELPVVTNSSTLVTPTTAMQGDAVGLYRRSTGDYAWDTNGTSHGIVTRVDTTRGTLTCKLIEANRLK